MSNLQRYGERPNKFGITQMLPDDYGLYVKFDDVKDLRSSTDAQQLKAEIAACANQLQACLDHAGVYYGFEIINKLRQLSAV